VFSVSLGIGNNPLFSSVLPFSSAANRPRGSSTFAVRVGAFASLDPRYGKLGSLLRVLLRNFCALLLILWMDLPFECVRVLCMCVLDENVAGTVMNSGEPCKSRPSESISPRRDETGRSLHEISPRRLAHLLSEWATRSSERDLA